jgi:hypothetical protein
MGSLADKKAVPSRLRKSIRSGGLSMARIISPILARKGGLFVDVEVSDSGTVFNSVPILRPDIAPVIYPAPLEYDDTRNTADYVLKNAYVLIGFLEGTSSPVVLGLVRSSFSRRSSSSISSSTSGTTTSGHETATVNDGVLKARDPYSRVMVKNVNGDILLVAFDLDVTEWERLPGPEQRQSKLRAALLYGNAKVQVTLRGNKSIMRITRNQIRGTSEFQTQPEHPAYERFLLARHFVTYKNLLEYPYIASLAHRIAALEKRVQTIVDLGMGEMMQVSPVFLGYKSNTTEPFLKNAYNSIMVDVDGPGSNPPVPITSVHSDAVKEALGTGDTQSPNPKAVHEEIKSGYSTGSGINEMTVRGLGDYANMANRIGLRTAFFGNDLDVPVGFGGTDQGAALGLATGGSGLTIEEAFSDDNSQETDMPKKVLWEAMMSALVHVQAIVDSNVVLQAGTGDSKGGDYIVPEVGGRLTLTYSDEPDEQ